MAVVLVAGAALMSFELVGSRLLAPYFGNSIYVWGSLIGVFLGALSIGYTAGGRLSDRWPHAGALALVLAAAAVLTALVVPLQSPVQSAVVQWNPGIRLNPLLSAVLLFGPASVLIGMVSPFAVRLRASSLDHLGSTAGSLYGLSTFGSIVGTIATAFWLIQAIGSESIVLLIAASLAVCSLLAAIESLAVRRRALASGAGSLLVIGAILATGTGSLDASLARRNGEWSPVLRAGGYREQFEPVGNGRIRYSADSQYHHIRVVDYDGGPGDTAASRVLHFDNSLQAGAALTDSGRAVTGRALFPYLRAFDLLPVLRPKLRHVLFIGLGSGAAAMRLHDLAPDAQIDVVEIDPEVERVARRWFGFSSEAADVHIGDGRSWLAASDTTYDAIIVDAYFADSVPFHLTTREFLAVVHDHLAEDGIVAANLIGAVRGHRSKLLRSMLTTWKDTFPHLAIYPVPGQDGRVALDRFANVEMFAARDQLPTASRVAAMVNDSPLAVHDRELARLVAARYDAAISSHGVPLLSDDYAPVDALVSVVEVDD